MENTTLDLKIGKEYFLDVMKEETGVFKYFKNNTAYFEGNSEYYNSDEEGLIPIFSIDGFIPVINECIKKTWDDVKTEAVNYCDGFLSIEDFVLYLKDNYKVVELTAKA